MINFSLILNIALVLGGLNTSLSILLYKIGFINWYEVYAPNWLPKDFCFFCFSFWLSLTQVAIYQAYTNETLYIFICPLLAASFTRFLLSNK